MSLRDEFENHPRFRGMDFTRDSKHPEYYASPYAGGAWDGYQAGVAARSPLTAPDTKCLACGGYHYGLSGLPCPVMRVTAQ
jgi:hypothetical protein